MPKKPFDPNLKTPRMDYCREENNKLTANLRQNAMHESYKDLERPDIDWEIEAISKSYGIYLEFNRANKDPKNKEWMYMIRISIPGGGPISREQWRLYDEISNKYGVDPGGESSVRFTTRQNIQFHWIKKDGVIPLIKTLAENDMRSINGCGDNTRNVMGTPLSRFSKIFNANEWAQKVGSYFQLPLGPYMKIFEIDPDHVRKPGESYSYKKGLLNRKFKIAFSGFITNEKGEVVPDNSVEILTNDTAIAPILEKGKVKKFQVYVGGGQGERNGKPSMASLAKPLGITPEDKLLQVLDAIVKVHEEWGDRQNRHWARLKYVIKKQGVEWYREQVEEKLGFKLEDPNPDHDYGDRQLYHGWNLQETNSKWAYGLFIENGRISDTNPRGKLKTLVNEIMNTFDTELLVTPNQDALFTNIDEKDKEKFEKLLAKHQDSHKISTLRMESGACVGRDTCRLTYTDSEKFEPELLTQLEELGWGDLKESIGITGCERQCFRPSTKTIGLVGTGLDRYQLRLFGDVTARFQGRALISADGQEQHLRSIPRDRVAKVIDALFKFYQENKQGEESLGAFNRRLGDDKLIAFFKSNETTSDLMAKPFNTDCVID